VKLDSQEVPKLKHLADSCLQTVYMHYGKVFNPDDPQQFFFILFWWAVLYVI